MFPYCWYCWDCWYCWFFIRSYISRCSCFLVKSSTLLSIRLTALYVEPVNVSNTTQSAITPSSNKIKISNGVKMSCWQLRHPKRLFLTFSLSPSWKYKKGVHNRSHAHRKTQTPIVVTQTNRNGILLSCPNYKEFAFLPNPKLEHEQKGINSL